MIRIFQLRTVNDCKIGKPDYYVMNFHTNCNIWEVAGGVSFRQNLHSRFKNILHLLRLYGKRQRGRKDSSWIMSMQGLGRTESQYVLNHENSLLLFIRKYWEKYDNPNRFYMDTPYNNLLGCLTNTCLYGFWNRSFMSAVVNNPQIYR